MCADREIKDDVFDGRSLTVVTGTLCTLLLQAGFKAVRFYSLGRVLALAKSIVAVAKH